MPSFFKKSDKAESSKTPRQPATGSNGAATSSDGPAPPPTYGDSANDRRVPDASRPSDLPTAEDAADVNVIAAFEKLDLSAGPRNPTVDTCLAHLKLLFAIQAMKEDVGYTDGLWDIWDIRAGTPDEEPPSAAPEKNEKSVNEKGANGMPENEKIHDKKLQILSKLREKRWAVFIARAVDRYEAWWKSMPQQPLSEQEMLVPSSAAYAQFPYKAENLVAWTETSLPPLGESSTRLHLGSALTCDRCSDDMACPHAQSPCLPRGCYAGGLPGPLGHRHALAPCQ